MWQVPDHLKSELEQRGHRFDFFEAARRLRQLLALAAHRHGNGRAESSAGSAQPASAEAAGQGSAAPGQAAAQPGSSQTSPQEPLPNQTPRRLRFATAHAKRFANREVATLKLEGDRYELATHVMGSFGHTGTLPRHDWDLLSSRRTENFSRAMLNIFNHRQIETFYQAWEKHRPDIARESARFEERGESGRPFVAGKNQDRVTRMWLSLSGFGLPPMQNRHEFPDVVFAGLASYFTRNVRTPEALARSLQAQFGVPVEVRQFVESRLSLPEPSRTCLGSVTPPTPGLQPGGRHNKLGGNAILGKVVPNHHLRFEIQLGPLDRSQLRRLSPYVQGNEFSRLRQFLQAYCGPSLDFDIRYRVRPEAILKTCLGENRLGFDSWLQIEPAEASREDPLIRFTWGDEERSPGGGSNRSPQPSQDAMSSVPAHNDAAGSVPEPSAELSSST